MTARVFVPLVGAGGEARQLFEAVASDEAPEAHPAQLSPQISELYDFGLYGVGQTVREATLRFIDGKRQTLWLSRANARPKPWRLRISDLQVGRLSDENARSAGLGLTLAALCQAFDRPADLLFATGEIVLPSAPGDASIRVGPVDGLRGKLALIGDYVVSHRAALAGRKITVVLPAASVDGRPTREAEGATLARLDAAAREAGATLAVLFPAALDDLDESLGPFALKETISPRRAAVAALAVLLAGAAVGIWGHLAHARVRLAFLPASPEASDPSPQRARYDAKADKLDLLPPCFGPQRQALVVGGETLVVRAAGRDAAPFASLVRKPRYMIASVSKNADPVLLDAEHFRSVGGAGAAEGGLLAMIPVEAVEDEAEVFILATRDPSVSADVAQSGLRAAVQGLSGPALFTAATTYLADHVGDVLGFPFNVTTDSHACPD